MSGTTTGGGPPHDPIIIRDPKTGKEYQVARSDVREWRDHLPDDHPLRKILEDI